MMRMPEDVGYPLRLPPELKATLTAWARHERRSLNAHIVFLLERAVDQADQSVVVEERTADRRRLPPRRRRETRTL